MFVANEEIKIDEYLAVFTHACVDVVTNSSPGIKVM